MSRVKKSPSKISTQKTHWVVNRRDFLKFSGVGLVNLTAGGFLKVARSWGSSPHLRFGMVTDSHYADAPPRGTRFYAESLGKMAECVALMNREKVHFLIELGDFKDMNMPPNPDKTLGYLRKIERVFQQFQGPSYHVLGNHDADSISKDEFLRVVTNPGIPPKARFYAFSFKGIRFLVLDANYRKDGTEYCRGNFDWKDTIVPPHELTWLDKELKATNQPVVVFVHQPLDGEGDIFVKNASAVRAVLERQGNVLAVFQGHQHEGGYSQIHGIHYYTLKALVEGSGKENNSYATVTLEKNGDIVVHGYRKAVSREWSAKI